MKNTKYEAPKIKIEKFETTDVILSSNVPDKLNAIGVTIDTYNADTDVFK